MTIEQQNQARDNIKKLMEEQGLSQPKLSDKAGIAFGTLSRILRGKQDLTIQTAEEIADALDMPINTVKTKIRRAKAQLLKMMDYSDELL